MKSSLVGMVYCIARPEEAIVVVVSFNWCALRRERGIGEEMKKAVIEGTDDAMRCGKT